MDSTIIFALAQDGITTGAIYALLAIALVLVFAVTRVILIPQGTLVAFAALTFCYLERGQRPGTAALLLALGVSAFVVDLLRARLRVRPGAALRALLADVGLPFALYLLVTWAAPLKLGAGWRALLTVLLIAPLGPFVYRLAFQPLQKASVLVLLMAAMGVELALSVVGLVFFGPEGFSAQPFTDASFALGPLTVSGSSLVVVGVPLLLMLALWLFFERTLQGKALRAVAINRTGAQLVGVPIARAGKIAFALAGAIGAVSGVLIAPVTMVYYDSGFLIGLKGFVAAVVGGIASYPLSVAGAFGVGLLQSFGAFWSSAYVEVIVFMMLFPVLVWRSLRDPHVEEDAE
jgi:branched-chain amino acid transport system permease protein